MGQIYEDHRDDDGFLYIAYSGENTFGASLEQRDWCYYLIEESHPFCCIIFNISDILPLTIIFNISEILPLTILNANINSRIL